MVLSGINNDRSSNARSEFVPYMERTRLFYRAQGFDKDYVWAHFEATPFSAPSKPLEDCVVTVVTTAVAHPRYPSRSEKQKVFLLLNPRQSLIRLSFPGIRKRHIPTTGKVTSRWKFLTSSRGDGMIKRVSKRFHFVPTQYSQKATSIEDAPSMQRPAGKTKSTSHC